MILAPSAFLLRAFQYNQDTRVTQKQKETATLQGYLAHEDPPPRRTLQ